MIDWQAIKTEYITTSTSYRKLAEKYGVSRGQLSEVGRSEKWVELREQHRVNIVSKTVAAVENAQANRAKKMQTVADKLLNRIEAMVDDERPLDTKAIRALTAAVKDLKEIQSIKSDLDEKEQRARIANLEKQADKDSNQAPEAVTVIMGGDAAKYAE